VEVKTILDYLRIINQPDNNDALSRVINTPSRRIGEATVKALLEEADGSKINLWSLILGVIRGERTTKVKLPKQTEQGLSSFVNIILTARKKRAEPEQRFSTVELIQFVLEKTCYEKWLEDHHGDVNRGRWDNVQELITQAGDFESLIATGSEDESLPEIDGLKQNGDSDVLSRFLSNVALASEVKEDEVEGAPTAQVTISTIHAAKGLEWPVVFIPAIYQGSIPHSRAEDSDEERRLLYVAMTRAKALLYMSYPVKNSQGENSTLSPFLVAPSLAPLLEERGPSLCSSTVQSIAQIVRRPSPSAESISRSSSYLRSTEDDLFPVNEDDEVLAKESEWNSGTENPTYTKGQRAPTRQKVEMSRFTSLAEDGSKARLRSTYPTTMDRASSFTANSVTLNATFLSAGLHLQALSERSVNYTAGTSDEPDDIQDLPKPKSSKKSAKGLEGQGTLFSFLGKSEPHNLKRQASGTYESEHRKAPKISSQILGMDNSIDKPRPSTPTHEPPGISPSLANHRLGAGKTSIRPRQIVHTEQHTRNDYVFLSSSPPKPKLPISDPEEVQEKPGLKAKPALLPLIRPATTMHSTTVSMMQDVHGARKTLGVKRSMNGWSSGNGQAFRPPTIKRPT
jgi:DNA helicase-2/ATP-dependent DNA helicase PcrA